MILVFFLVISALCNAKGGGQMKLVIILYLVGTFIAGAVAVFASTLFPVDLTLSAAAEAQSSPSGIGEVLATLVTNVVANPVAALMSANYLGILAWAVVLGIALRRASDQVKDVFSSISDAVSTVVRWIISLAPFGILGLIYTAVSTNGVEIFTEYGQLLLVLVGCMLFIAFVTNPILSFACFRKNPYGLVLRCLKDSGLTAFFTRSSAANIPVNMELCRKLSHENCTVLMVTHNMSNINLCDKIAFLGTGGVLCYYGSPEAMDEYFDVELTSDIFEKLHDPEQVEYYRRKYFTSPEFNRLAARFPAAAKEAEKRCKA